jgi:hypothetical protein
MRRIGILLPAAPDDAEFQTRVGAFLRLSGCGYSCQFGRASAPMMPQPVDTMRGPKAGTAT